MTSDQVTISMITAIASIVSTIVSGVLAYLMARLNKKTTYIHTLVNSSYTAQLKMTAVALKRLALLSDNPDDLARAKDAEDILEKHNAEEAIAAKKE